MSSSFPLLQLPLLPLLDILKDLKLDELIFLSMLSKRAKRVVEELNVKIEKVDWSINDRGDSIALRSTKRSSLLYFAVSQENEAAETFQLDDGRLLHFWRRQSRRWTIGMPYDRFTAMDLLTEHIFDLFRLQRQKPEFEVDLIVENDFNIRKLFLWNYTKTFDSALVDLRPKQMKFVFEQLKIANFTMSVIRDCRFRYYGPLTMDVLHFMDEDNDEDVVWFSRQSLVNMHCRQVTFEGYVPEKLLNAVVKNWLAGGLPNLEQLSAKVDSLPEALKGIKTTPWNPRRRPQCWRWTDLSSAKCVDIRRDDGKMATINTDYMFEFYVWHEKFFAIE